MEKIHACMLILMMLFCCHGGLLLSLIVAAWQTLSLSLSLTSYLLSLLISIHDQIS